MKQIALLHELGGEWIAETASGGRGTGDSAVAALAALAGEQIDRLGAAPDYLPGECLRLTPQELEVALQRATGGRRRLLGARRRRLAGVYQPPEQYGFRLQRLLIVESTGRDLAIPILPGGGSLGYFVLEGDELSSLHGDPHSLGALLRAEGRGPREWEPDQLAWLLSEACGRDGACGCQVVDADALKEMEDGSTGLDGYVLDLAQCARHASLLVGPHWSETEQDVVEFTTVSGWMHELQQLDHWVVRVPDDWRLDVRRTVLSKKIFKVTPSIRY